MISPPSVQKEEDRVQKTLHADGHKQHNHVFDLISASAGLYVQHCLHEFAEISTTRELAVHTRRTATSPGGAKVLRFE